MPIIPPHSYSRNISGERILIIGRKYPVRGGVAVHVERVAHRLREQGNEVVIFDNEAVGRWRHFGFHLVVLVVKFLWLYPRYVYYHTSYLSDSYAELVLLRHLKVLFDFRLIFVEHNCRHLYSRSKEYIAAFRRVIDVAKTQIVIGSLTYKSFYDADLLHRDVQVESAFLPPCLKQEEAILHTYPRALFDFMRKHPLIMVANAAALVLVHGRDLYGIDACIAALAELHAIDKRVGCVIALGRIGNKHYYQQLLCRIRKLGLEDAIFFLEGGRELWPLIKRADLLVRPTLSDGASISVEEALYFKVQVIASDVCERPEEVKTYKAGDQQALNDCVKEILYGINRTFDQQHHHLHS